MWGKVSRLRKQHDGRDWASSHRPSAPPRSTQEGVFKPETLVRKRERYLIFNASSQNTQTEYLRKISPLSRGFASDREIFKVIFFFIRALYLFTLFHK